MKNLSYKIISILLAVLMATTCMPLTALADEIVEKAGSFGTSSQAEETEETEETGEEEEEIRTDLGEDVSDSGMSNNCIWSYDSETKTMTVGGTNVSGYADDGFLPTYKVNSNNEREYAYRGFKHLVINASVLTLDNFSLDDHNYPYIESVEIKGVTLTRIGHGVFAKCKITSLDIPSSVKEIGIEAFHGAYLTSITLPRSLTTIGELAFAGMPNLETVNANPCKITSWGLYAFTDCENLKTVDFSDVNFYIRDEQIVYGSTYDEDYDLYQRYSLPASIFSDCTSLKSVVLNSKTSIIGDGAFYRCKSLTDINLENIKIIGENAFNECYNLNSVDLSSMVRVSAYGFANCRRLRTVVTNPDISINIGRNAFSQCAILSDIDLSNVLKVSNSSFCNTQIKSIHIKELTGDEEYAFQNVLTLEDVVIDKGKTIAKYMFSGAKMNSITLPKNYIKINERAFEYATIEEKVTLESTADNTTLDLYAFYSAKLNGGIDISNSNLGAIGSNAFAYSNIKSIFIPYTVGFVNYSAFRNCRSLEEVIFEPGDLSEGEVDISLEIDDYAFFGCTSLKRVVTAVTNGISYIGEAAFKNCSSLTEIDARWIMDVEEQAFMGCSSLETLDCSSAHRVYTQAFSGCTNLKEITIYPLAIAPKAFENCSSLESFEFDNTTSIDDDAFNGCAKLKEVDISNPNYVKVGNRVFANCTSLESANFGTYVMSVGVDTFDNCTNLTSITFNNFSTEIEIYGSNLNPDLVVYCGRGSTAHYVATEEGINTEFIATEDHSKNGTDHGTIGNGFWRYKNTVLTFYGDSRIGNTLVDGNGKTTDINNIIRDGNVTKIEFSDEITNIPNDLFKNVGSAYLNKLKEVVLPKNLKTIGSYAFYACPVSMSYLLTIPDTVEYIGSYAFCKSAIKNFDMSNIKHIGDYAFAGCINITNVDLSGLTDNIGAYAFESSNLANVVLPNVERYNEGAFINTKLTSIVIPSNVRYIGKRTFGNCQKLTKIEFTSPEVEIYYDENNKANSGIGYTSEGFLVNTLVIKGDVRTDAFKYAVKIGVDFESTATNCDDYGYVAPSATSTSHVLKWYYYEDDKSVWITGGDTFQGKFFDKDMNEITDWSFLDIDSVTIADDIISLDRGLNSINPKYIYLPETMSYLNGYAFAGCTNLRAMDIPDSVFSLGDHLFDGCTKLKSIHFGFWSEIIPAFCMVGCTNLQFLEMDNVNRIKTAAFKDCSSLLRIDIPDSTEYIDDTAFINCHSVMEINLGKNILYIGDYAFANMPLCYKITFNSTINVVRNDAFSNVGYSTTGVDVVFGDSIAEANLSGFTDCNIATINVGSGFKKFINIPRLNSLVDITVSNNSNYYSYEHCLYSGTTLVYAPQGLTSVDIKEGTKSIGDSAFMYSNIQVAKLPEGIRIIGDNAFKQAENLKAVRFPNTINSIGNSAFEECSKLKTISIPYPCQYIGDRAFKNCKILASVLLPEGLFTIGDDCFNGCVAIERMVFPRSLVSVGAGALAYNPNLKAIYVWNATLGYNIFYHSALPMIYTMAGSNAHGEARTKGYPVTAFADEEMFAEICFEAIDDLSGYLGYCVDGHGEIEWLTVYKSDCENDGYEIGVCEYCSEILDEHHTVATGHRYSEIAYIRETATDYGIRVLKCDGCGEMLTSYYRPLGNGTATEGVYNVSGKVYADNGKAINNENTAIENAEIYINGSAVARTGEDGSFRFKMKSGNYIMEVRYAYGFTRYVGLSITDHDVKMNEYAPINIVACDFNKDGKIDAADQTLFMLVTASKVGDVSYLKFIDLNNDGYINAKDYVIINRFYGATALTYQYPELTIK